MYLPSLIRPGKDVCVCYRPIYSARPFTTFGIRGRISRGLTRSTPTQELRFFLFSILNVGTEDAGAAEDSRKGMV